VAAHALAVERRQHQLALAQVRRPVEDEDRVGDRRTARGKLELSPAVSTSGEAVNTVRTSAGSETTTIGASVHAVRSVNGTP
jgi:hypothetical protein